MFSAQIAVLLEDARLNLLGSVIWDKGTTGNRTSWGSFRLPTAPALRDRTEEILILQKGEEPLAVPSEYIFEDERGKYSPLLADPDYFMKLAQDLWSIPPESAERIGHPAPVPVELAERLIRFYAYPSAHILDPFCGSGSTLVAALRWGCRATGLDLDASYCALARERCEQEIKSKDLHRTR
jgi:DNA modification methylase